MSFRLATNSDRDQFDKKAIHPLQTWEWGEFRTKAGNEVVRFVNAHKNTVIDSYTLILHKLPFSKYKIGTLIKCPRPTRELFPYLQKLATDYNLIFIKLEPNETKNSEDKNQKDWSEYLKSNGCVKGKTLFTPTTFWIDLTESEEGLMKSFSSKTRYNIRLAKKRGVKVVEDDSENAFEKYLQLTFETAHRQGFYAHTRKYHKLMWQTLHQQFLSKNKKPIAHLLTAVYENEILTTWVLFVWKDFLYYPYGASSDEHKNVMANNLIMWEAIRIGKKLGLKTFDLWGREEGKGFTKFKEGYNPKVVEFLGSWDFITNKWLYYPYRVVEYLRWKVLKLPAEIKHKILK